MLNFILPLNIPLHMQTDTMEPLCEAQLIKWYLQYWRPKYFGFSFNHTFICVFWKLKLTHLLLQVHLLSQPSPVLTSLKMVVELWISLWAGHWVVETVLIYTSSTLPPMIPRPHMGDFWTSPQPGSYSMNWLVLCQAMSTISQYVVWQWTAVVWWGGRVSPW